jgi:hypothetical protein
VRDAATATSIEDCALEHAACSAERYVVVMPPHLLAPPIRACTQRPPRMPVGTRRDRYPADSTRSRSAITRAAVCGRRSRIMNGFQTSHAENSSTRDWRSMRADVKASDRVPSMVERLDEA